jgi:hypothetical protein
MVTYGNRFDNDAEPDEKHTADGTSVREDDSPEEHNGSDNGESSSGEPEEDYAEIAFEDFPEDFKDLVKNRLQKLGKVGVAKKAMREVQTEEDVGVFEANADEIVSLELLLTTPAKQIPFHYVINTQESFDQLFFEYDVIQTIVMAQHGQDVIPDDANDITLEDFMKNLEKYKSYILSDARSRSGTTPKEMMEHINLIQANSSGILQIDNTKFGDISYMKYHNRVYGTQTDSFEENAYRQINSFENTLRAYIGLFQNTYISTSQPLLDVMIEDANNSPTNQETSEPTDLIGFQ